MNPTTDTPLDACPHCGADFQGMTHSGRNKVFFCGSILGGSVEDRSRLCWEREARLKAEAEVAELNRLMIGWKQRAAMSETDLEAEKAEVERLRGLLEEAIPTLRRFHYANLSIHLRQCLNNIDSEKQPSTPTRNDHENNVRP